MPDPRSRIDRADDAIAEAFANRAQYGPDFGFGLIAVAQAILATVEREPRVEQLGHFVPIGAWQEFTISSRVDEADCTEWAVFSSTLGKVLEVFETFDAAIEYRDHMLRTYNTGAI